MDESRETLSKCKFKLYLKKNLTLNKIGRKDLLILIRLGLCILESGKEGLEMGLENKCGLMMRGILENGKKIERMGKESLSILMETFMKASGLMTKLMARAFTIMSMGRSMRETGKMTSNMAMA
jgi:hypothetical protein